MSPTEIVNTMYGKDYFSQWLGISMDEVGKGHCRLSMTIRKEMLNGFGIAHGGIAYSLADSALAFAANSHGRHALSIETSVNHLEKLVEGDQITAVATEEALRNKLGFYKIEIKRGEDTVAIFRGLVYRRGVEWTDGL